MNMPEYIRTEVTQLRFVVMRVVLSVKKARSIYMGEYRWRSSVQTEQSERSRRGKDSELNIFLVRVTVIYLWLLLLTFASGLGV